VSPFETVLVGQALQFKVIVSKKKLLLHAVMLKPVRAPTETNEIDSTMALNSVNFIIMIKPAAIIPIT
jgi:hypothetical protein